MVTFVNLPQYEEFYRRRDILAEGMSLSIYQGLRLEFGIDAEQAARVATLFVDTKWLQTLPIVYRATCSNCGKGLNSTKVIYGFAKPVHLCRRCKIELEQD